MIDVAALLCRFGFLSVTEMKKFSPEQRQKLLEELGFPEERLRRGTKDQPKTLQSLALVEQNIEKNKRIREIEEEKHDTTQGSTNLGQELDKTPRKKIKITSPQQKTDFTEDMIINPINDGNNNDPMAGVLFEEQEVTTQPTFMFEKIKDLSQENGENKEELEEDK